MKKVVVTFGIISGIIVSSLMLISMSMSDGMDESNFDSGEFIGYAGMLIALSAVFFGIRSYRDKYMEGIITFKSALVVGLYISLIAAAFYVTTWMIYSQTEAGAEFMDSYFQYTIEQLKESGLPQAEIDAEIEKTTTFMEYYENPFVKIGMTFLEIFPVGLIVSLISAAILRKKETAVTES